MRHHFLAVAGLALSAVLAQSAGAQAPVPGGGDVPGYHGGGRRAGLYVVPGLTWQRAASLHPDTAFDGRFAGHVYAQPLYWRPSGAEHGRLLVASESNIVSALDAASGQELWRRNLGPRVAGSDRPGSPLPCGDIDPLGITGTPVLDSSAGVAYVDAFVDAGGSPEHVVHALSLLDGHEQPGWPVVLSVALRRAGHNFTPLIQNQRSALTLFGGRLFVPFGGHAGDCRAYHGWVVGLEATTGAVTGAWVTRAQKGGIWAQAGVADDGASLFATTGNTSGATSYGDGEGVFRLGADLAHSTDPRDFFAPANWQELDRVDEDLGSTGPLPIDLPAAGGAIQAVLLQLGKDGNGYVLPRANLGGVGRAPTVRALYDGRITTGPAVFPLPGGVGVAMYGVGVAKNCPNGVDQPNVLAVEVTSGTPPGLTPLWCAAVDGRGSPIVTTTDGRSDAIVWMLGAEGDNRLHAFRASTGEALAFEAPDRLGVPRARHFATPIVAEGRLFVAGDGRLHAFVFGP